MLQGTQPARASRQTSFDADGFQPAAPLARQMASLERGQSSAQTPTEPSYLPMIPLLRVSSCLRQCPLTALCLPGEGVR